MCPSTWGIHAHVHATSSADLANTPTFYRRNMISLRIVPLLALAALVLAIPASAAVDTVALQAEVNALRKDSDLLTGTLTDNWNAFKTSCGKVLTDKCADFAKIADAQVLEMQAKKEKWAKDNSRRLGGKRDGGKHHGGKHHGGKHHGGKHEEPAFIAAMKCVLKANFATQTTAPNTNLVCDRSAKRFELYTSVHRPPMHRGPGHHKLAPVGHLLVAALVGALMTCLGFKMFKCCRTRCKKSARNNATVTHVQASSSEHVVMGEPVVVAQTQTSYTVKQ